MAYQLILHGTSEKLPYSDETEHSISEVAALGGHVTKTLDITHINAIPTAEIEETEYINGTIFSFVKMRLEFEVKTQYKGMSDQLGGGAYPYSDLVAILKLPYHWLEFDGTYYNVVSDIETKVLPVALKDFAVKTVAKGTSQVTMKFKARWNL